MRVCWSVFVSLLWMWHWMMCVSAEHRLAWTWCDVMCVSPLCAYLCMCVPEREACRGWVFTSRWMVYVEYPQVAPSKSFFMCTCVLLLNLPRVFLKFTFSVFAWLTVLLFQICIIWVCFQLPYMFACGFVYVSVFPGDWQPYWRYSSLGQQLLVCLKVQFDHDFNSFSTNTPN